MAVDQFPDVLDYLLPYFDRCKAQITAEESTVGEIHIARSLLEVVFAVVEELDCDTQIEEGLPARLLITTGLKDIFKSLNAIEQDVGRPREERRAELIGKLSQYQRNLLGIKEEEK